MESFKERKQKKERGVSNKELLQMAMDDVDKLENVVIVAKAENGEIPMYVSYETNLEALGLLEVAKTNILDWMSVEE